MVNDLTREYVANVAQTVVSDEEVATFISGLEYYYDCCGSISIQRQQKQNSGKNSSISDVLGSE